jgi:DcuC family C4-dicarboxylate transporter
VLTATQTAIVGLVIIAGAVAAILRRVDVRLALMLAALGLGAVAGQPEQIVRTFLETLTREQFIVPICCAMGFAYVLKQTGCDRHLVEALIRPMQRAGGILVPGTVLVGFLVNIPVISQTSTAVAIGSVLIPLLRAAGVPPVTTGAALLLGCSIGGELLNPGAPEFRTVTEAIRQAQPGSTVESAQCVERVFWLVLPEVATAIAIFWILNWRQGPVQDKREDGAGTDRPDAKVARPPFRINPLKAAVPLLPITLLFLTSGPLRVLEVPREWLVKPPGELGQFDSRLIGAAMLVGVAAAAITAPRVALGSAATFFEGAGYAYAHIIAVIVTAQCFGKGVELTGLAALLGEAITARPALVVPTAGALPLAFAWVSGSGMASTQSLYGFFVEPALKVGLDPLLVGAVVSLAAAAGRTMSPVAAVTLMCAAMTQTNPFELVRRVVLPLFAGIIVVIVGAAVITSLP